MIASIGEALIDFIYLEEGHDALYKPAPGGSPYNTSMAIARLGIPAAFLSPISTDMFGKMLLDHIKASGVNTDTVISSPNPTTLAFAKIVNKAAEYAFFSNGSADRSVTAKELKKSVAKLPEAPDCYQIGSISLLQEPGASEIISFIKKRPEGSIVSFDPNIRASLVEDRRAYLDHIEMLFEEAAIVKISDEDLAWIFPEVSMEEAAEQILSYGPAVCVVTAGKEGVYWFSNSVNEYLVARDIEITDTIGAGDTFHAGLLSYFHTAGKLSREKLEEITRDEALTALKFASMAAEINCTRQGANPPTWKEQAAEMSAVYQIDIDSL